jgi:signal transduction histidine kinase
MRCSVPLLLLFCFTRCSNPAPVTQEEPRDPLIDSAEKYNQLFHETKKTDLTEAAAYADRALAFSIEADYPRGIADGHAAAGYVHYYRGNYPAALETYVAALSAYEQLSDSAGIARSCYFIGKIHRMMHNFDQALDYANRGLALDRARNSYHEISSDLNGIGNIYVEMGKYDSAFAAFQKRIAVEEQHGDSASTASALGDLAAAYTANGDPEKGLQYHLAALHKLESVTIDSSTWYLLKFKAGLLNDMAGTYFLLGDHGAAVETAEEGLALAASVNARKEKRIAYKTLAELYGLTGREHLQMQYMEKYIALNDSLLNEEGQARIAEAEVRYRVAENKAEIARLDADNAAMQLTVQKEKDQKMLIITGALAFAVLVGATGLLIYARNRMRYKEQQFRAMIEGEQSERRRIAMELHDGLGQLLSSARLNVAGLEESVSSEDEVILKNSLSLIDEACTEVRNVSHNLMPSALIKLGLVPALRELASKISHSGKMTVAFQADQYTAQLPEAEETALYRIIQETVNNALKYSRAAQISITLSGDAAVKAIVHDNGIGMPKEPAGSGYGIGWSNIRSRTELLRGKLDVQSAPGEGTTVTITIPTKANA